MLALVVEHRDELRVLVGPAGERVEEQLEADVARGLADRAHEREVGAREGDRVVACVLQHLRAGGDRGDVCSGVWRSAASATASAARMRRSSSMTPTSSCHAGSSRA